MKGVIHIVSHTIRIPKQKRALEKRQAIIQSAFILFSDKGYHHTNTAEIAKKANVSTGIVYNYFCNKYDILKEVIKLYIKELEKQFDTFFSIPITNENLPQIIEKMIDTLLSSHMMSKNAHNEFLSLALVNKDLYQYFDTFENKIIEILSQKLIKIPNSQNFIKEKLHISYTIVEKLCHDYINGKINEDEFKTYKQLSISTISLLLLKNFDQ